jgi:hypothetical protein
MAACAAGGCSLKKLTIDSTADLLREGSKAFDAESDLMLARAAAPGQLKTIEGLLVSAPRHRTLLAMAARGYLEYAFGFIEDDLETLPSGDADARRATLARANDLYDRALLYSVRFLETFRPEVRRALVQGGDALDAALRDLPREALPGLAYGGMAIASAVNLNRGDPSRLADLPKAEELVLRAHALDPGFYHGGAAMTLAILAVQRGDQARARAYFVAAEAASGGRYLLPRVMRARTLLVETRARQRFREELEEVLAVPRDAAPEARLANEVARRRAERYLEDAREGRLF